MTFGTPVVVIALPLAYREGVDEYNGVMRYLREAGEEWDVRIVRHSFGAGILRDASAVDVDGVICGIDVRPGLTGYEPYFDEEIVSLLASRGIPFVGIDLPVDGRRLAGGRMRCVLVSVDSESIGRRAAQYLAGAGEYASFGSVGAFSDRTWSRDRCAFFARELRRIGRRRVSNFRGDVRRDGDALIAWLRSLRKPSAVFASNDYCAAIVLKACMKGGLRVPDDMSVLGVDDDPVFCIHTRPTLSSLRPDFEEEGFVAARALANLMAGGSVAERRIVVGGEVALTARMSTAPCSPAGKIVRRADELIAERACNGLTADMLAGALGISRRLLDLRYGQIAGRSVRTAIEAARLERVRDLLVGTALTHALIAKSTGFSSESYLEHVFLRRFGMTMSQFRAQGEIGVAENRKRILPKNSK
ncbi:MAG: substrate-binding domain-containing protein [Kiritimatiellae bacterium]|nr:substrate-binding domain-containing protein [Kiritimatiellia bacterium]